MAESVPARGNRSSAKVGEYLRCIARGETLETIGKRYGVSYGAVRKRLKTAGLPTCAIDYLRWLYGNDGFPAGAGLTQCDMHDDESH